MWQSENYMSLNIFFGIFLNALNLLGQGVCLLCQQLNTVCTQKVRQTSTTMRCPYFPIAATDKETTEFVTHETILSGPGTTDTVGSAPRDPSIGLNDCFLKIYSHLTLKINLRCCNGTKFNTPIQPPASSLVPHPIPTTPSPHPSVLQPF